MVHTSLLPLARSPVLVRQVSPPASNTTPALSCAMSRHARLTSDCGTLPPTVLYCVVKFATPRRFAEQLAGIAVVRREHVHHADGVHGLDHPGIRGLPGGGDHQVDRFDRRRSGSISSRWLTWPKPINTGVLGSTGMGRT